MKYILAIIIVLINFVAFGQVYTSYFTGNTTDTITNPESGVCIMGGGSEHDEAMKWFLQRANGGDVLVIRTSGSNGYNSYLYSDLGIAVNSVETIVFNNASASTDTYIHNKIQQAEAIWIAGGDQWNYVSYWRNTPIDSLINLAIKNRNIVIGGTSAGMAIQGGYYFSAKNGTVTSASALANPYNSRVTVDSTHFIENNYLKNVITDTHYDDPNRKGRHIVFLARILLDYGIAAKGIACNEYTAVCIDKDGLARVYGDYPSYEESAYFIQTNCELTDINPENCTNANPLDWNLEQSALRVYKVNGTDDGHNTFDLSDWETGNGGTWQNWYVDKGKLIETSGSQPNCSSVSIENIEPSYIIKIYPNPAYDRVNIKANTEIIEFSLYDLKGSLMKFRSDINEFKLSINIASLPIGIYFIKIKTNKGLYSQKLMKV